MSADGSTLPPAAGLPDLDDRAGRHFVSRDLCEAGETWHRLRPDNRPTRAETYAAIACLCRDVLDPVVDRFGRLEITYGFAGPALFRKVRERIAPKLDQHAGHEVDRRGQPICPRLGQAVDFRVPGVTSSTVAGFIAARTPFDRLYYYGADRPLHVSVGPDQKREVAVMRPLGPRRRVPRRMTAESFMFWLDAPGDSRF